MTLRTIAVPAPALGADWSYQVPGKYLLDITGITATLDAGGGATVMVDSSGNGLNGTYVFNGGYPVSVGGLLAGGNAVKWDRANPSGPGGSANGAVGAVDWIAPWSVAFWYAWNPAPLDASFPFTISSTSSSSAVQLVISGDGSAEIDLVGDGGTQLAQWGAGTIPVNGARAFIVAAYDGADLLLYVNGALATPSSTFGAAVGPLTPVALILERDLGGDPSADSTMQAFATFPALLTGLEVATLYLAGLSSLAAFSAGVLGLAPEVYYELGDPIGGPRQVVLRVLTSTGDVAQLGSGFELANGGGPFAYSWQPRIPQSTQTEDGSQTTIAIPRLVLPAGYTVGTRTLDIGSGDQWSGVTLWWDDATMLGQQPTDPYRFPPGSYPRFVEAGVFP